MLGTGCITDPRPTTRSNARLWPRRSSDDFEAHATATDPALDTALDLIAIGRSSEADRLLTPTLLETPDRADLWLAAGIARLRRGATRSAAAALRMAAWICDDPLARELLFEIEDQKHSQTSRSQAPPTS